MSFITGTLPSRALARTSSHKRYTYYLPKQTSVRRRETFQGIYINISQQSATSSLQYSTMNPDSKIFGHSKYSWSFFYVGIVAIVAQWMYFLEREPITGRLHYVSLSPDKLASMEQEIEGKVAKKCDVTPGHPTARVTESIYFRLNAAAGISNERRECYFINAPSTLLPSTLELVGVR